MQTNEHRKTVDILKSFISARDERQPALTADEQGRLRVVFRFLRGAYAHRGLGATLLATNQTHFYTMVTTLLHSDILESYPEDTLIHKLVRLGEILDKRAARPTDKKMASALKQYETLSSDRTTDTDRRKKRQEKFAQIIEAL